MNKLCYVPKLLRFTKSKCQDPSYLCKQCFQKNIKAFLKQCCNFQWGKKRILNLDRLQAKLKKCFLYPFTPCRFYQKREIVYVKF